MQKQTQNNVDKTWTPLRTREGKDEPNILIDMQCVVHVAQSLVVFLFAFWYKPFVIVRSVLRWFTVSDSHYGISKYPKMS